MINNRPLILLDVDGPLNPCEAKPHRRPDGYITLRLRPKGFEHARKPLRVWLNPDHGRMLLEFAAEHDAELVWATTWEHDANAMIGPAIGLPELPVIVFGDHPNTIRGWKYPAVRDYTKGRAIVWLDDDFKAVGEYRKRAKADFLNARHAVPTLLHHVDPRVGITQTDLNSAGDWLHLLLAGHV